MIEMTTAEKPWNCLKLDMQIFSMLKRRQKPPLPCKEVVQADILDFMEQCFTM